MDNFLSSPKYDEIVKKLTEAKNPLPVLKKENIKVTDQPKTKEDAIHMIAQMLLKDGYVTESYENGMLLREKENPTNLGNGIAIPHGVLEAKKEIKASGIAALIVPDGIVWNDETVRLVIGIAGADQEHLSILSNVALTLNEEEAVRKIVDGRDADELYHILTK